MLYCKPYGPSDRLDPMEYSMKRALEYKKTRMEENTCSTKNDALM